MAKIHFIYVYGSITLSFHDFLSITIEEFNKITKLLKEDTKDV